MLGAPQIFLDPPLTINCTNSYSYICMYVTKQQPTITLVHGLDTRVNFQPNYGITENRLVINTAHIAMYLAIMEYLGSQNRFS